MADPSTKYHTFHKDQAWIMRAYDELPLIAKKQIQSSIFDNIRVTQFGEPSSFCRVFKINDTWLAKVNRYTAGSVRSTALVNNFTVCKIFYEYLKTKPYLSKYIVLPEYLAEYHEGGEDVFIRFERKVEGVTVHKYMADPEKRAVMLKEQPAFLEAFYTLIMVLAVLVHDLGFNHNDMHLNNVMFAKEDGKYIPKILDFDLTTLNPELLPAKYIHNGILKAANIPDRYGCEREWWVQQQKEHSALIPGRQYPSPSIDCAMFFDTMQHHLECDYKQLPIPEIIITELQGIRSLHYNVLILASRLHTALSPTFPA